MTKALRQLHQTLLAHDAAIMTDGQLLERFLARRDDAALEMLVRRHGPMVWGVCRRVLRNHHDAEDAFQATFLVLVRKADSVRPRDMVANWLYGVAQQTARKAKAMAAQRQMRERTTNSAPQTPEDDRKSDLVAALDEELARLPEKYRAVIVLCDLEGQTRAEAAARLRCPEGTIAGRLARARGMLAQRLARRGLAVSGAVLATLMADHASAGVPTAVLGNALHAFASAKAIVLAVAVVKGMLLTKLARIAAMALVFVAVALGGGFVVNQAVIGQEDGAASVIQKVGDAKGDHDAAKKERARLQGTWRLTSIEVDGKKPTNKEFQEAMLAKRMWVAQNEGRRWTPVLDAPVQLFLAFDAAGQWKQYTEGDATFTFLNCEGTSQLDFSKKPKTIDLTVTRSNNQHKVKNDHEEKGQVKRGIYEVVDDTLRIAFAAPGKDRLTGFAAKPGGDPVVVWVMQRVRKAPDERVLGNWSVVSFETIGDKPGWFPQPETIRFSGTGMMREVEFPPSVLIESLDGRVLMIPYALSREATPHTIDFTPTGLWGGPGKETYRGIYRLDGEVLRIYMNSNAKDARPAGFDLKKGTHRFALVLRRAAPEKKENQPPVDKDKIDDRLLGAWEVMSMKTSGAAFDHLAGLQELNFHGTTEFHAEGGGAVSVANRRSRGWSYALHLSTTPRGLDLISNGMDGETWPGIYRFDGDTLTICISSVSKDARPAAFDLPAESNRVLLTLQRSTVKHRSMEEAGKLRELFKANADQFEITISRHGYGDSKIDLQSITLHASNRRFEPSAIGPSGKPIFKTARITKEQAIKIIDHIDGFPWGQMFRVGLDKHEPPRDKRPYFHITIGYGSDANPGPKLHLANDWNWNTMIHLAGYPVDGEAATIMREMFDAIRSQPAAPKK
jgi:RNA polymerase sigma factor (sigma-70 family)